MSQIHYSKYSRPTLYLDFGNYQLKWSCGQSSSSIVHEYDWSKTFTDIAESLREAEIDPSLAVIDLRPRQQDFSSIAQAAQDILGIELVGLNPREIDTSKGRWASQYEDLDQLGCDRWCGMLSAMQLACGEHFVVVNAGSAITADFVRRDGRHLGGHINLGISRNLHGVSALLSSLYTVETSLERRYEFDKEEYGLGQTTEDGVYRGMATMIRGYLHELARQAAIFFPSVDKKHLVLWFFAGGDGKLLLDSTTVANRSYNCDLIIDGIKIADSLEQV